MTSASRPRLAVAPALVMPTNPTRRVRPTEKSNIMSKSVPAVPAVEVDESDARLVTILTNLTAENNRGKFEVLTITASEGLPVRVLRDSFKKAGEKIFKADHAEFIIHLASIYAVRSDWKDYEELLSTFRGYTKNPNAEGVVLGVEGAVAEMTRAGVTTADLIKNKPQRKRGVGKVASEKESATAQGEVITLDNIGEYLIAFADTLDKDGALRLAKVMVSTSTLIKANAMARESVSA